MIEGNNYPLSITQSSKQVGAVVPVNIFINELLLSNYIYTYINHLQHTIKMLRHQSIKWTYSHIWHYSIAFNMQQRQIVESIIQQVR